jgi:triosephosphate isomerase
MKKLIAGNWKMNGSLSEVCNLMNSLVEGLKSRPELPDRADFVICPPYVHLALVHSMLPQGVVLGAQDCASQDNGAYTGDISAKMLKDVGCQYVILGHSERRQYHGEANELIAAKVAKAHDAGLKVILCVGETEAERDSGRADAVVIDQLRKSLPGRVTAENTVIAYEPVWAIGTGKVPSSEDVEAIHATIRACLKEKLDNPESMRILYGGSVKPENAGTLLTIANVDGALAGGASLKADQFLAIAAAATAN